MFDFFESIFSILKMLRGDLRVGEASSVHVCRGEIHLSSNSGVTSLRNIWYLALLRMVLFVESRTPAFALSNMRQVHQPVSGQTFTQNYAVVCILRMRGVTAPSKPSRARTLKSGCVTPAASHLFFFAKQYYAVQSWAGLRLFNGLFFHTFCV